MPIEEDELRPLYLAFCFSILLLSTCGLTAIAVLHIAGIDIPDVEYDLVVGKPDSLLYFYKQEAASDSLWISSFTCNSLGYVSSPNIVYSYHFEPAVIGVPVSLLFEYRYGKLYHLAQIDSTTIIASVINESGNSYSHLMNTSNVNFAHLYNPYSKQIVLFNDNMILGTTTRTGCVYTINLVTNEVEMILSFPGSMYRLFPLMDNYVIVTDILHDSVPNYFIDSNMTVHALPGYMPYGYYETTKVGEYYLAKGTSLTQACAYSLLSVQNDMLTENIVSEGVEIVAEDECIVPLDDSDYLAIFRIHYVGGSCLYGSFVSSSISNGEIVTNASFPQLTSIPDPRNLFRINENCIVALSGVFGSPINFTSFDPETQQFHTDTYQIDNDSYQWEWDPYPAGNNFYLIKGNRLHSFRVVTGSEVNDSLVPQITDLSCYPNPFSEKLDVIAKLSKPSKLTVNIYDIRGRKLKSFSVADNRSRENSIRLTHSDIESLRMSSGVYYVQVISDEGSKVVKTLYLK